MNTRYRFITYKDEYEVTNLVKNSFMAAKSGQDVDNIINFLLTTDEVIKLGRRIQIASFLAVGMTGEEIKGILKVGRDTVTLVGKHLDKYPKGYELISDREAKVQKEFVKKAYKKVGGSKLVFKKKQYSGFKRKDVKR